MYVRPHLDYGDVIYHKSRVDLIDLIESVQYKAALIVTGCWQGTSRVKLYDELGWESLSDRRWARRLTVFHKIKTGIAPSYISEHLPIIDGARYNLRNKSANIPFARTERYENSCFPYSIKSCNNLGDEAKSKCSVG